MIQYGEGCSRGDVLLSLPWFGYFEQIVVKCFPNFYTDPSQEMTIHFLKQFSINNNGSFFKSLNLKYIYKFLFVVVVVVVLAICNSELLELKKINLRFTCTARE